jgi:hypothetical protein
MMTENESAGSLLDQRVVAWSKEMNQEGASIALRVGIMMPEGQGGFESLTLSQASGFAGGL